MRIEVVATSSPPTPDDARRLEALYASDLVFKPDCWKLCGDAHCCSFSRYRDRFKLLAHGALELPLLPGEFDLLTARGWDRQFGTSQRTVRPYDFGTGTVYLDTVSSARAGCGCDHDTRTVICRLYPLLPVFDVDGRLTGTERMGVYDELEALDALTPACRVDNLPFEQLQVFLTMCTIIGSSPVFLFHLAAYRDAKRHVFERLRAACKTTGKSAFRLFEAAYVRRRLVDHPQLRSELAELKRAFEVRYGDAFGAALGNVARRYADAAAVA